MPGGVSFCGGSGDDSEGVLAGLGQAVKPPVWVRAVVAGSLVALVAANVWPILLVSLGTPLASAAEILFLVFYVWWTNGAGPPRSTRVARRSVSRAATLSPEQWTWGLFGALSFAVTVHASIVILFRLQSFPIAAFRRGYDLSFIPSVALRWLAVVISAMSAGVCEETGFRGYMQQPLEERHGPLIAILLSALVFTAFHLSKAWAVPAMIPVIFGAGVLLGLLAWSSGSLIPSIVGHVLMDIGMFAYWWTGIAGDFTERPISEVGIDRAFLLACVVIGMTSFGVFYAIKRLRRLKAPPPHSEPA